MKYVLPLLFLAVPAFAGPFEALRATAVHLNAGSGSVIEGPSGRHYLITNWHVCQFADVDGMVVGSYQDGTSVRGPIVANNMFYDLCLVDIQTDSRPALKVSKNLKYGERVYTRGFPAHVLTESTGRALRLITWDFDLPLARLGACPKGTRFTFTRDGRPACNIRWQNTLTDVYSQPGSSGSPVVNSEGELVGVMQSYLGPVEHGLGPAGGMVPLALIHKFLSKF